MKPLQFFSNFSRGQQKGILILFTIIIISQSAFYIVTSFFPLGEELSSEGKKQWLAMQARVDELKIKARAKRDTIYPFNPNYVSDYKGYILGLTKRQIKKLNKYREKGNWINSAEDFQNVTGIHDTLLKKLAPSLKFPDWVAENQQAAYTLTSKNNTKKTKKQKAPFVLNTDINKAGEKDLREVYGVGHVTAKKILDRRKLLGAYVSMDQMDDFAGFSSTAITGLKKLFLVKGNPKVKKLNINTATFSQLSSFPYFSDDIANAIINQRSAFGKINNLEELSKINDIFTFKSKIIGLYLEY